MDCYTSSHFPKRTSNNNKNNQHINNNHRSRNTRKKMLIQGIIIITINSLLVSIALLLLKKGSPKLLNKLTLIGLFLYAISAIIYVYALKYGPVSILAPITSTTYIYTLFISKKVLKEKITMYKVIGISLIILGITLLSFQ